MKIEEYLDKLYGEAQKSGADEFQIIYNYKETQNWKLLQGKLEQKTNTENQVIAIMLKKDGKIGSCYSRNLDEKAISEIINYAMENARLIDETEENFFYDGKGVYATVEPYRPMPNKIAKLNPIEFMKDVEQEILKADKRILPNPKITFQKNKLKQIIKNSLGINLHKENEKDFCSVFVIAKDGNDTKSNYEKIVFDKEKDFEPSYIAQKAVKKAVKHLHGIKPKSGPAKVVFAPESLISILDYLGYCTSAYSIDKKHSQFAEKLGEVVASPIVTIIEDPLQKGGYSTSAFDNEGVPTYKKELISKGVLKTYLYSLKTAHKAGVKPTGNDADSPHGSTLRNLYMEKGNISKEELLKTVENGIYVDYEVGFTDGIRSNSSGDFSFSASGFLIENGKIGRPLEQFTVAGNYYQMLKDSKLIADDLEFSPYGVSSPTIWVDGLTIGGK
ncbi:MAG: TldD/PmbA family protein [Alphaproteobacteria bacterium]|nr:TldD/PmbA family protein [Alphaproteobacteria bacterium]